MVSSVVNTAFDCADPYTLAGFWSEVTGCPRSPEDRPGDPEASIALPDGMNLFFQRVPEPKRGKNRLHLCLRPQGSQSEELDRLLRLGATVVDDRRGLEHGGWVVLADPEGNEFCLLRERAAAD